MTEYLKTVQFAVRGLDDWDPVAELDAASKGKLPFRGAGTLSGSFEGQAFEGDVTIDRTSGTIRLSVNTNRMPTGAAERLHGLQSPIEARLWLATLNAHPPGWLSLSLHIEFVKPTRPEAWTYSVFDTGGEQALLEELRQRYLAGEVPDHVTLLTLDDADDIATQGLSLHTFSRPDTTPLRGPMVISEAPAKRAQFLAQLQLDHIFLCQLKKPAAVAAKCSLRSAADLAKWIGEHDLRSVIAARHVTSLPADLDTRGAENLLDALKANERELVDGAVTAFKEAAEAFRDVSTVQLRDLAKMRGETANLMGAELFRVATSIAITIAGLSFAKLSETTTLALAIVVGLLFFVGAAARAITQEREFRQYLEFNALFARLPTATAMPQFREWYARSLVGAVRSFYATFVGGILLASLPLVALACYAAFRAWPGASVREGLILSIAALAAYGILALAWKPSRKAMRLLSAEN